MLHDRLADPSDGQLSHQTRGPSRISESRRRHAERDWEQRALEAGDQLQIWMGKRWKNQPFHLRSFSKPNPPINFIQSFSIWNNHQRLEISAALRGPGPLAGGVLHSLVSALPRLLGLHGQCLIRLGPPEPFSGLELPCQPVLRPNNSILAVAVTNTDTVRISKNAGTKALANRIT